MTAEVSGGHESVLDHDKEKATHELLTMPTPHETASNGYLRKRRGSGAQVESNGFIVADGQTREDDDDGTTKKAEEEDMERPKITSLLKPVNETKKVSKAADAYLEFFNNNNKDGAEGMRQDNSSDLANQYYDLATDFFEYGWGESFHFFTIHKGESFEHAVAKHEYRLALKLRLEPGEKVLDMGCGVGGPARHIALFSDTKITGLNINDYQIRRARELTKAAGVGHLCTFVKGDFCKAPLESETFDKAYAIEASCHAADLSKVYREAYRLLKPGGLFASYEWVMTDKYDPTNPYHKQLKEEIMLGDGLPDVNSVETVLHAIKSNGFELLETADLADHSPIPWYSVMQASWTLADFKITPLGRWLTHVALMGMELVGFAPSGSVKVHRTLCKGADSLVNGGKEGVFSPMYLVVARKPGLSRQ